MLRRRPPTLAQDVPVVLMEDLFPWMWLDFLIGWTPAQRGKPPRPGSDDWTCFADFLRTYRGVRTQFRDSGWGKDPSFAEELLRAVEGGEDVEVAGERLSGEEPPT